MITYGNTKTRLNETYLTLCIAICVIIWDSSLSGIIFSIAFPLTIWYTSNIPLEPQPTTNFSSYGTQSAWLKGLSRNITCAGSS